MRKLRTLWFLFGFIFVFAQDKPTPELERLARINLSPVGLEAAYELPLSKRFAWENTFGIGMGVNHRGSSTEYVFDSRYPTPYLKSELKYIYNRDKRAARGKANLNNSGNYVALQAKYSFGNRNTIRHNSALLTEIHWGIQSSLGKRFLFNTHIGLGYLHDFDNRSGTVTPTLGIRFGYRLFK